MPLARGVELTTALRYDTIKAVNDAVAYIRSLAEQRFSATLPGPASGDNLLAGAWAGRPMSAAADRFARLSTTAKLLLMTHAFETLGVQLVGWRTDNYNFASQRAIERLGARKDGVLRHHALRRDGTVRDTVMYSLTAGEWPEVKAHLQWQLTRPRT